MSETCLDENKRLANLCEARESVLTNGPAAGARQIDLRAPGGVDLRVLPDRGFDIAQAWWRGRPIAWVDPSREALPTSNVQGADWLRSFAGGLLTTCGLRHVGQPSGEHGLHGRFSQQRSQVLGTRVTMDSGTPVVSANALILEPESFGPLLEMDRTIATWVGVGRVDVRDALMNRGLAAEPVELLYHLNFPYRNDPLPSISVAGEPVDNGQLERGKDTVRLTVPQEVTLAVELRDQNLGTATVLSWDTAVFSRLYLWMYSTSAVGGILALEPSTAPLLGKDAGLSDPLTLEPGERLEAGFRLMVGDLDEVDCSWTTA